jgi:hypothetical protein
LRRLGKIEKSCEELRRVEKSGKGVRKDEGKGRKELRRFEASSELLYANLPF